MREIDACWITINRACNLRCNFCYTNKLGFKKESDMKWGDFLSALEFCKEAGVKNVTLIGGEPTVYDRFFDCIKVLNDYGFDFVVVTNGVLFSNDRFMEKALESGIKNAGVISVSVKDVDEAWYVKTTGVSAFEKTFKGYWNLKRNGIPTAFSFVITPENIDRILEGVKKFYDPCDNHYIGLSICYDFNETMNKNPNFLEEINYPDFIHRFVELIPELDKITDGKWNLQCGIPRCLIRKDDLEKIASHTYVGCQLIDNWGLVLDTDLTIIPCNSSFGMRLGKLGKDFKNFDEYTDFCQNKGGDKIRDYLRSLPSKKCLDCELLKYCKGGCISYWSQFTMDDVEKFLEKYKV